MDARACNFIGYAHAWPSLLALGDTGAGGNGGVASRYWENNRKVLWQPSRAEMELAIL